MTQAPVGTFSTFIADPPWRYGNTATRAAAQDHYDTLSIAQLCGEELLPDDTNLVKDVVLPKAATPGHLYLWTTAGHLPEAFAVMDAWDAAQKIALAAFPAVGVLTLTSVGKSYALSTGFLTNKTPVAPGKKVLMPQKYRISWGTVISIPIGPAG